MPPKPTSNSRSNGRHQGHSTEYCGPTSDFTRPNENFDDPLDISVKPYVHKWANYSRFVDYLIGREHVPSLSPADTGSSSGSTSIVLPPLHHPLERVVATIVASFDSLRMFMNDEFQKIRDRHRETRNDHTELQKLKKEVERNYKYHENMGMGVLDIEDRFTALIQALTERVTKLESELVTVKAERDEAREAAQQIQSATNAQLQMANQRIETLTLAVEHTQEQIGIMAAEIQAFGEVPEQEMEEVEPMVPEVANEEPEVIDPEVVDL